LAVKVTLVTQRICVVYLVETVAISEVPEHTVTFDYFFEKTKDYLHQLLKRKLQI
jgi:hypothetical protein